ncbi:hypothetical protein CSHISOI_06653, partial [Colletotrichum shisoi]
MAAFVAGSLPNVDHGGEINQNMSNKGLIDAPSEISAAAQTSMGIRDHIDKGENATKTNATQPERQNEPMMLNETYGGSPTAVEISSNDNLIPRQDEPAGKSVPSEEDDKNPDPPPPPLDSDMAGYYAPDRLVPSWDTLNWITSRNPGRNAVHGLVEYMRGVDDRLQVIEKKLQTNEETIQEPHDKVDPPDETGSVGANKARTEVKFFEAVVEDFTLDGNLQDNATDYGRFSYNKDQPQVLRVLYNKLSDHKTIDQTNPDPAQVEIIYLSILSDPIASFFRDVLGLDCGSGYSCMRFSKPFRPLIRNLKPLRDHLAKLKEAYGYRVFNFGDSRDGLPSKLANNAVFRNLEVDQKPGEVATGTNNAVPSAEGDVAVADDITAESISSGADFIEGNSSDSHEQHEKSFLRRSSLPDFKTIVGFVEQYLDKSVATYENLKSGRDDKVAFENVWMLFDAGTTIYCPYRNGTEIFHTYEALSERRHLTESSLDIHMTYTRARSSPQAYCVLATRGGVPLRQSLTPGGIEEDDEENDFLQSIDFLPRLEQLELPRQGESPGNRKDAAQPALGRHGLGGAPTRRTKNAMSGLVIACFSIEYDGYRYGPQRELFEIKPYDGLKDVRSMEIFPVQYLGDAETGRLLQRGRKFVDLANNAHMSYEGTTAGNARETINSDVIVDFKIAFERNTDLPDVSEIKPIISKEIKDHWPSTPSRGQLEVHDCHASPSAQTRGAREEFKLHLEENNLIGLFPGVVPGYALRNRKWVQLDLDRLQVVHHDDEWNNLVLPKGHREMVQAMVESYTKRSDGSQPTHDEVPDKIDLDLVRGKENRFFLRILEYYPGILFLTTNRVGAIDDAFRSRLHLTLYYPKLVEKQSIKIWKNNIKKMKEVNEHRVGRGQLPIKYDKNEIIKWVELNWESLQWNGRQIRNAFQTAIALAEFKAQSRKSSKRGSQDPPSPDPKSSKPPVLNQDTFLLIAEASNQFNDYLLQTHGQDEETTASRDQMRPANFKMKPTRIKRVESSESDTNSDSSGHSDSDDTESDESDDAGSSDSDSETEKKAKKAKKAKKGKKAKAKKSKGKAEKAKEDGASLEEEGEKKKRRKKKSE